MKNCILIIALLVVGCQHQVERPLTESEKLADKQYYQFFGWMLFGDGDEDTAIESLFKSAEAGNAEAQIELGGCYAERPDLIKREKPDIDSAVIWWLRAAEQDEWMAQRNLAYYYADIQDWKQAKFWLKRAKKNGYKDKELQKRIRRNL